MFYLISSVLVGLQHTSRSLRFCRGAVGCKPTETKKFDARVANPQRLYYWGLYCGLQTRNDYWAMTIGQ